MGSCSEGVPQIFFKMLGRANLNNVKPPSETHKSFCHHLMTQRVLARMSS